MERALTKPDQEIKSIEKAGHSRYNVLTGGRDVLLFKAANDLNHLIFREEIQTITAQQP